MQLRNIVPWGRNLCEYQAMFSLADDDLQKKIVGIGDGPASFNAEATVRGATQIISVDPLYAYSRPEIAGRIDESFDEIASEMRRCAEQYVWTNFSGPEDLLETRMTAMRRFLSDYEGGIADGRYVAAALPELPFEDRAFELALCSHLLFLYSDSLSQDFHQLAIREMLRVADEVRIFPLLDLTCKRSVHIDQICRNLKQEGFLVQESRVDYEFQKGGNAMLRIERNSR